MCIYIGVCVTAFMLTLDSPFPARLAPGERGAGYVTGDTEMCHKCEWEGEEGESGVTFYIGCFGVRLTRPIGSGTADGAVSVKVLASDMDQKQQLQR